MLYESNVLENFDLEIIFPTSLGVKDMGSEPLKWLYCQRNEIVYLNARLIPECRLLFNAIAKRFLYVL